MLTDAKPVLQSGTVWAGLATIIASVANATGHQIADADVSAIVNDITVIATAVSGILTIYFRIKATKTLTLKPTTK